MAGAYDDAPSRRMATDQDGTVGFIHHESAPLSAISPTDMGNINTEENTGGPLFTDGGNTWDFVGYIFPEKREWDGWFIALYSESSPNHIASSQDTTNGVDGTWDVSSSNFPHYRDATYTNFRDEITSVAVSTCASVRLLQFGNPTGSNKHLQTFHVYGAISPGETPDRILFLDTENSDAVFTKVLDFAEVPRGQTTTRTFKIKNNSASLSINTVQVTAEDSFLNAGGWYEFGDGGGSYQATYSVGNMANGAEETIHMKQIIPDNETLGLQTARIRVAHADLT